MQQGKTLENPSGKNEEVPHKPNTDPCESTAGAKTSPKEQHTSLGGGKKSIEKWSSHYFFS